MPGERRADFTFEGGGLGPPDLEVVRFDGNEGVSELFRFDVEMVSRDPDVDIDAMLGANAVLTLSLPEGERKIHGIVSRFELTGMGRQLAHYSARLVPKVWTLSLRRQSRIFQGKNTPEIIADVLDGAGIPLDFYKTDFSRTYKSRNFCVQYRETDLDFLMRLLEEDGIFTFFEQTEDSHILMMGDHPGAHPEISGAATVPLREAGTGMAAGEEIVSFQYAQRLRPGKATLRDWDYKKPKLSLEAEESAESETQYEWYDYPGGFPNRSIGGEVALLRLQEERAERARGAGEGNCRRFTAGHRFTLEDHPNDLLDGEYLITRVQHWGSQPQAASDDATRTAAAPAYRNSFECIPSMVPFRPARVTPIPLVAGPQTAIVTGADSEEIHTDEFACVKVRFHWDRSGITDDGSSCWLRVGQGWGGAGWGMMFLPRVGQEVVVEFLEGDPNRPVVTGRVYNGENPPPHGLPASKTVSTLKSVSTPGSGGVNEVKFDDAAGSQLVAIHAEKDKNIQVANNRKKIVNSFEQDRVGGSRSRIVGADETIDIGTDREETILGGETIQVLGSQTIEVGSLQNVIVFGSRGESVGGSSVEKVGALKLTTVGLGSYTRSVGGDATETVGAANIATVKGSNSRNVGSDESVIATAAKVVMTKGDFLMSIGGTLTQMIGGLIYGKVDGDVQISAPTVTFVAAVIQLKGGGSTVKMSGGPISIKGSKFVVDASSAVKIQGGATKVN